MKYTEELLEEILQEGGATVVGKYEKFNQRMRVTFRCKCGKEGNKKFEMLNVYRSPYCEECSTKVNIERMKETFMNKYGVENAAQNEGVKKKINDSFQTKFGGHPKRNKEVQEKWKATCLEKYGGHPNQNIDVQARSEATSFKHKDYVMPSGKIVKIQGYEDRALDELLQMFPEDEIAVGRANVPTVKYVCNEGVNRTYFPDFYIKSLNTILEVKSEWTIRLSTCRLKEKANAVVKAGYRFEVWVYNVKGDVKENLTF